jgi:hypothetical protein
MHPSYFLILNTQEDDPKREFVLSPGVSEWLFSSRFWDDLNQEHETLFSQYEEEVLPVTLIPKILTRLRSIVTDLSQQSDLKTRFRYGWNEKKDELICVVGNDEMIGELSKLITFIEEASGLESDVYCQL